MRQTEREREMEEDGFYAAEEIWHRLGVLYLPLVTLQYIRLNICWGLCLKRWRDCLCIPSPSSGGNQLVRTFYGFSLACLLTVSCIGSCYILSAGLCLFLPEKYLQVT